MKKFKLKKIKITPKEKQSIIFLLIILFILLIPIKLKDSIIAIPNKTPSEIINSFKFEGELASLNIFEDKYASVLYKNDGNYVSHLIDLKKSREVVYNDFIKKEEINNFKNKIHELLLLKYPSKIVDILENDLNKEYSFEDRELVIYFYPKNIDTTRKFILRVNYNEIYKYLNFEITLDEEYTNESGFELDPNKKAIAFSFDDGPNNERTVKLVNALEDYKMSATFFMVGYKLENDIETVKKVAASHSEIGYHSYKHSYFTKQTEEQIKEEFKKSDDTLYNITGLHFKYTRPPYGAYNQKALSIAFNVF